MKNKSNGYYNIDSSLKFKITEAYKTIRTNIIFSVIKKGCKKIIISSSCPAEGKSTMTVNVAVSMAQTEAKVLLVDCDLRRPKVHRFFSINNAPGLTNYLSSMNKLEDVIRETPYPNLKLVTAGSLAPNPSEMLSSEQFKEFIEQMEKQFDYIFIDSTPLNVVADALPVVNLCDGVILVVREKTSTTTELDITVKKIELINAKILGIIYNGIATQKRSSYGYNKNYGSTYGSN